MQKARDALNACLAHRRSGEHQHAYADAQLALRALRMLMRAQWDQAVRNLDSPVSSPYAVSYFTLPRHWEMLDELRQMRPGQNLIPDGDFEAPPERVPEGWLVQEVPSLDPVKATARRVTEGPLQGKQCLMLQVASKSPLPLDVLERTFIAIHSPTVQLEPGTLVRISAWVRTRGIGASADGALLYDSAGGEPLAVRIQHTKGWRRYSLYRRVPASGQISVTMAMTGLGQVFFDDVRIEPLVPAIAAPTDPTREPRQQPVPRQQTGPILFNQSGAVPQQAQTRRP